MCNKSIEGIKFIPRSNIGHYIMQHPHIWLGMYSVTDQKLYTVLPNDATDVEKGLMILMYQKADLLLWADVEPSLALTGAPVGLMTANDPNMLAMTRKMQQDGVLAVGGYVNITITRVAGDTYDVTANINGAAPFYTNLGVVILAGSSVNITYNAVVYNIDINIALDAVNSQTFTVLKNQVTWAPAALNSTNYSVLDWVRSISIQDYTLMGKRMFLGDSQFSKDQYIDWQAIIYECRGEK